MHSTDTPGPAGTKNHHAGFSPDLTRYAVSLAPIEEIKPSPENDDIYGEITADNDPGVFRLVESIRRVGLEEPLILTMDGFILSGHRRFVSCRHIGWTMIPVRYAAIRRDQTTDYHRRLAELNPQRIKSVKTVLAEEFLQSDDYVTEEDFRTETFRKSEVDATYAIIEGVKRVEPIGPRKQEFLEAAVAVVQELEPYWPISVRTVHYRLLNNPPLTQATQERNERWRYRNDQKSYDKLSDLLVYARYAGCIPMGCIDDPTRISRAYKYRTYLNPAEFIQSQLANFMQNYRRHRLEGQPNHVEVLLEKNTLLSMCEPVCDVFMVPVNVSRGYGNPSVWRKMEDRFLQSGAEKFILLSVADHDPEGFNLVDDAVRSLRQRHGLPVHSVRVGLTMEQIQKQGAHPAFAKESSSRFQEYVNRTGSNQCWEAEALDPHFLEQELRSAILSVLDMEQLKAVQDLQETEREQIKQVREKMRIALAGC